MSPDVVELLLPEADEERRAFARRVATCLRLLANDASPRRASRVGLALESARSELARDRRERLLEALRGLLVAHLAAVRSADAFLTLEPADGDVRAAWSALEEERASLPWLAGVPAPGESPLEVAGRLLVCARRLGLEERELSLWEARRTALALGAREGERAFRALLARSPDAEALAGALECLLERGAVGRAQSLFESASAAVREDARVARLAAWLHLLATGSAGDSAASASARLPASLVALRRVGEPFRSKLPGRVARGPVRRLPAAAGRREVGAALLAVFVLRPDGTARCLHAEAAPARSAALRAWCEEREHVARSAGELEHAALSRTEACVEHRCDGVPLRGAQEARGARAAAVAPVLDRDGEPLGWLRLEFEHHLVPSPAVLRELARAWRANVAAARPTPSTASALHGALSQAPAPRADDPRGLLFAELVEGLGLKLAQRRWWGVMASGAGASLVAEGGGALEHWRSRAGRGRGLERALVTAGAVRFDDGDLNLALAADARSGVVLPLRHGRHLAGVLAVESTRRRDLRELEARLGRERRPWALELRLADFRAWDHGRCGGATCLDLRREAMLHWVDDLLATAETPGPICLSGAPGSGRRAFSRLVHHASPRREGSWSEHVCGARSPDEEARALFGHDGALAAAREGTLHLERVEALESSLQLRLAEAVGREPAARVVLAVSRPLREGALVLELARALAKREFHVPTLHERRAELAPVIAHVVRRSARELGRREPELDDALVACLWRQPYAGELRELGDLVYRLVLCARGERLTLDDLHDVARRARIELSARVPSRDVDPTWVEAALWATRTQRGGENKTRAALYLGWDPDTLARVRAARSDG